MGELEHGTVIDAADVEPGDEVAYVLGGERWLIGDVVVDDESGYTYHALLESRCREFETINRIQTGAPVEVHRNE